MYMCIGGCITTGTLLWSSNVRDRDIPSPVIASPPLGNHDLDDPLHYVRLAVKLLPKSIEEDALIKSIKNDFWQFTLQNMMSMLFWSHILYLSKKHLNYTVDNASKRMTLIYTGMTTPYMYFMGCYITCTCLMVQVSSCLIKMKLF